MAVCIYPGFWDTLPRGVRDLLEIHCVPGDFLDFDRQTCEQLARFNPGVVRKVLDEYEDRKGSGHQPRADRAVGWLYERLRFAERQLQHDSNDVWLNQPAEKPDVEMEDRQDAKSGLSILAILHLVF